MTLAVRPATPDDARACATVYAPYVTDGLASFESEPPDAAEMSRRMAAAHVWLVLEQDDVVVGFAYGAAHRSRAAYAWSCETSVYLAGSVTGQGGGRLLYEDLLGRLTRAGFQTTLAGVVLPNPASETLHRRLGFETVGTYRNVGYKAGRWLDVLWLQRPLGTYPERPAPPEAGAR